MELTSQIAHLIARKAEETKAEIIMALSVHTREAGGPVDGPVKGKTDE